MGTRNEGGEIRKKMISGERRIYGNLQNYYLKGTPVEEKTKGENSVHDILSFQRQKEWKHLQFAQKKVNRELTVKSGRPSRA